MGVALLVFIILLMILFVAASLVIFLLKRHTEKPLDDKSFHETLLQNVKSAK